MATWPEGPMVVIPGTAASPKSISTGPSGPSRTLPGLKSRCTIPAACTAPSAVSVATAMRSSVAPPRGPSCSTTSTSDGPLTYSLTMNGRRSKIPASRTCAVQNRATRCAAATSFRKRLRTCGSVVGGRSLTAAWLPAGPSARNTTPCPPSPRRPSNRYPPTSRGSVSRRASIFRHCGPTGCHPAILPRRLSARHNSVSPVACRGFPCSRLRFRELLLRRPARRRARPVNRQITEVLVSAQDFVPGPKISTLAEKAVVFPLSLLASSGLPGWLPTWGRRAGRWGQ